MANAFQPWQVFTNRAMLILKNQLILLKDVNRDDQYLFAKEGMKAGQQVNLRRPARFVGRVGEGYSPEAYTETSVPVTIRPLQGMDIDIGSTEWILNLDRNIMDRVLTPAMAQLANNVERDCLQIAYQNIYNYVGVPGTIPNTVKTYSSANALLTNEGSPDDGARSLVVTPDMNVEVVDSLKGLFNPTGDVTKQNRRGRMFTAVNFDWFETANLFVHTVGLLGGTPIVTAANQSGNSINTSGWTASTKVLNKGDVVQFALVNAVNTMTRATTGKLRNFVVGNDVYSDGSGNATIPVGFPGLIPAGQFQNVTNAPAASAAVTTFGSVGAYAGVQTAQGMAWHPNAFTFACIKQPVPGGVDEAWSATDKDTGIQLRFVRGYDGKTNTYYNRFDVLYAFAVPNPELGCRICSLS
jgi:hypothetical protein